MVRYYKIFLAMLFLASFPAFAKGPLAKYSWHPPLLNSKCYGSGGGSLSSHGARANNLNGASSKFENSLPAVLARASHLMGGNHLFKGLKVDIRDAKLRGSNCGSSAPGKNLIKLTVNCQSSDTKQTQAHFAHELGHIIAVNGNLAKSFMKIPRCNITNYCSTVNKSNWFPRSEEFAEVFATYMHGPEKLRSHCPSTYEFLRANVFRARVNPEDGCSGKDPAIAGKNDQKVTPTSSKPNSAR